MLLQYVSMSVYGIVAGLMASVSIGPIGVLCIQRTLSDSRRSGFVSGLGAATADTIFAGLAIFALSWVTGFMERYEIWITVIGGILIVVFGLTIFMKKVKRSNPIKGKGGDLSHFGSVWFLTLTNPACFFIFMGIFTAMGIVGTQFNITQKCMILFGVYLGAGSWWFMLTWMVDKFRKRFTLRSLWWMNKILGGIIMFLGSYVILRVVYQLISALIATGKV